MNGNTMIIDASVALKWWLRDEDSTVEADQVQIDFLRGDLRLVAPTLFDYEIVNTLKMAFVRNQIDET